MFIVYILFSEKRCRYYVGYTSGSVQERLQKHLSNHTGFTGKTKDWQIAYSETYTTKEQAMQREK